MKLLLIDIGNTFVHLATSASAGDMSPIQRHALDQTAAATAAIEQAWAALGGTSGGAAGDTSASATGHIAGGEFDDGPLAVLASVVPQRLREVRSTLTERRIPHKSIRDDIPLPMEMAIENPGTVGVDRVLAAAAAYDTMHHEVAVIQMGTAITVDCVSRSGVFLGGAIMPGIEMQAAALHERTAALPLVSAIQPYDVFGRNSEQAIRSGIFHGTVGAMRWIVERFAEQLQTWPTVVLTGGSAPLFADCDFVDRHVPDLTLRGLALAARLPAPPDANA